MAAWDSLYVFLIEKYKLSKKVALVGVSRGGLYVYRWAKRNPEKVSCIYAEAPVCDFKSWPAGFGSSEGSENDWIQLKKEYGFNSDDEAKAYQDNPIDNLEEMAKAKIPLLHMIGLDDQIVPPEENTFLLINRYIRLGGTATVVPCTNGKHELKGHHFPIETPGLVADFIKYHSRLDLPLESSNYHHLRGGIQNSKIRFENLKRGKVAFLGGSITHNGGWRDSVCGYLINRFPDTKFEFIQAGIPSMGSTPGAFRLERDVLNHGPIDLLFVEAAVNDAVNARSRNEQIKAMEGIVRHSRTVNPAMDIVMMHFVDPDKISDYKTGKVPEVIQNHNVVAEHYLVSTINLAQEVSERIQHNEFTWENDFKDLHPSPFGQGIYAHSIIQFLEKSFTNLNGSITKISNYHLAEKLDRFCYDNGSLVDVLAVKPSKGWVINENWKPNEKAGTRPDYVNVPMLIGEDPGRILEYKFEGKAIGIAIAAGSDAGIIEYRIDNGTWKKLNLFTRWSEKIHLPWFYTLADELTPGKHKLDIRLLKEKDERSNGRACRIRYFYINKAYPSNESLDIMSVK